MDSVDRRKLLLDKCSAGGELLYFLANSGEEVTDASDEVDATIEEKSTLILRNLAPWMDLLEA